MDFLSDSPVLTEIVLPTMSAWIGSALLVFVSSASIWSAFFFITGILILILLRWHDWHSFNKRLPHWPTADSYVGFTVNFLAASGMTGLRLVFGMIVTSATQNVFVGALVTVGATM